MKDNLGLGILLAAVAGWLAATRKRGKKVTKVTPGTVPEKDQGSTAVSELEALEAWITDRRAQAKLSSKAAPYTRKRDASKVDAVVLHQMGFSRGSDPSRYDKVTAHYKILPDGAIIWSHDWSTRLPASNGFNSRSLGVEFAGNFPKVEGSRDPKDFWSPDKMGMNNLTPEQIRSGQILMRYLDLKGITHVFAHRQSSASRGIDPGPAVWRNVGEYAISLGMSDGGPGYKIDSGNPIPDAWRGGAVA